MAVKQRDNQAKGNEPEAEERQRIFFRAVAVFDVSQTSEIPGADVVPLVPPSQPIDGDSHAALIEPLERNAASSATGSNTARWLPAEPKDGVTIRES